MYEDIFCVNCGQVVVLSWNNVWLHKPAGTKNSFVRCSVNATGVPPLKNQHGVHLFAEPAHPEPAVPMIYLDEDERTAHMLELNRIDIAIRKL